MTKQDIINEILNSELMSKWHWFTYHFSFYLRDEIHVFADDIVQSIWEIGQQIPGADSDFITKIVTINGAEKNISHYEQLMQILSEIIVIRQIVNHKWKDFIRFEYEPRAGVSDKNPEINIVTNSLTIGIEVKSPQLIKHSVNRQTNPLQLVSRNGFIDLIPKSAITLPRDNPIKDFLISADGKFKEFKDTNSNYLSILYIVWDDHIHEPISTISSNPTGLFRNNSFAKNKDNEIMTFDSVDYVVMSRHRFQLQQMAAEGCYCYQIRSPLDYGLPEVFPYKVYFKNPFHDAIELPTDVLECLQIHKPSANLGAEYLSSDLISW